MSGPVHVILFLSYAIAAPAQAPEKVNWDSPVARDFNRRVADYVKLRKTAQKKIHRLKPTKSPEVIEQYEHHLAHRIREARYSAVQGNIFTPEIKEEFRRVIGITMQGPEAAGIRQSLQRAAPVRSRVMGVNSAYPAGLPLQSTPPSLLLKLPPVPPEVEYRLVGHDLVLRDVEANLVVDLIPNAIP